MTGSVGAIIGGLQEAVGTFKRETPNTIPVVVPAAGVLAAALEYRRRRMERLDADLPADSAAVAPLKALGLGVGVAAGASTMSFGERLLADRVAWLASGAAGQRGSGAPARSRGGPRHARQRDALPIQHVLGGIERKEESIETAFDIAPPNPFVSGSFESHVSFETISKQGRRFGWTVTSEEMIRSVMQEEPAGSPVRVYVGLESAPTEEERVRLVLDELERTDALSRSWVMVASPTGTGYVNYAAVAALELLSRGDCATVGDAVRGTPVGTLARPCERGPSTSARCCSTLCATGSPRSPEAKRPEVVLFGESLGAWTSQDAFVDRGTQGLLDAGIDHAIWIGTPHFSKWKEQVLYDDRSDVDPITGARVQQHRRLEGPRRRPSATRPAT